MEKDLVYADTDKQEETAKVLSLVSHKLKTPLSIINGYSEAILSQSSKEKFSPFTAKALEEINKQGTKLYGLVDKLLFFNKVASLQPKDLTIRTLNLKELVQEAAKEVRALRTADAPDAAGRDINLEIDCPFSLEIKADEELLGFLIKELLINAAKFNNKAEKIIKVQCAHHGESISVSVRDFGEGVRPQDVNQIFERFYQVDDYFTGQVDGWGLGLPCVKKILQLHGGGISVVSDRGLGSIFTVSLPAA